MNLRPETDDLDAYLISTDIIDYENSSIKKVADGLAKDTKNEIELVRKVYEFVRDDIHHSVDINGEVVTCTASDVLKHKQGMCYAKAHLLAAILRHLNIPTGFCYQKLILNDEGKPWLVLHGLNAVYLKDISKWIRLDARGNKEGVNAEFSLDDEKLAFTIRKEFGESDDLTIYVHPGKNVISALTINKTVIELLDNLPSKL